MGGQVGRYFFHLHGSDGVVIEDHEGSDLRDSRAAHDEAVRSVRTILMHACILGQQPPGRVLIVTDEGGHEVDAVHFADVSLSTRGASIVPTREGVLARAPLAEERALPGASARINRTSRS